MKPDEVMEKQDHHDDEPGWYDKDSYSSDDDEQGHDDEPGWYDKDSYFGDQ